MTRGKRNQENAKKKENLKTTSEAISGVMMGLKDEMQELKDAIGTLCNSLVSDKNSKDIINDKMCKAKVVTIEKVDNQVER